MSNIDDLLDEYLKPDGDMDYISEAYLEEGVDLGCFDIEVDEDDERDNW